MELDRDRNVFVSSDATGPGQRPMTRDERNRAEAERRAAVAARSGGVPVVADPNVQGAGFAVTLPPVLDASVFITRFERDDVRVTLLDETRGVLVEFEDRHDVLHFDLDEAHALLHALRAVLSA